MANSFNFTEFKNGKNAINGLGQEVRFVMETRGQMLVQVIGKFGRIESTKMNLDGKKYTGVTTAYDLVAMKEVA